MTNDHNAQQPNPSESMVEADTANGEAPDTDLQDDAERPGLDEPVEHPTGEQQAEENRENDPPA